MLVNLSKPLELMTLEMPKNLSFGQVLVRLRYSGACASQLHEIDGRKGEDKFLPHLLGHEGVGEVIATGSGVSKVKAGDQVVAHWRPSRGIEAVPSVFQSSTIQVNAGLVTTFSEFAVISESRVTLLPQGFDLTLGPLLGCALTTGYGAVTREAQVRPGEAVVIFGFGGIGISILKSLKLVNASPIVVVDVSDEKTNLALTMGADYAINLLAAGRNLSHEIYNLINGWPNVVFEATGKKAVIEEAFRVTDSKGRMILIGVPDVKEPAEIPTLDLHLGKSLIGSHGGSSNPDEDIPRLAGLSTSGVLNLSDFPISMYPLEEINSALESLRNGVMGRVLIEMYQDYS